MIGQFSEDTVRVFAAELGCALGVYEKKMKGEMAQLAYLICSSNILIRSQMLIGK